MIELEGVAVRIGARTLLQDVHARVSAGELVAVLGPNGVGKTTLLRAIAGLHQPAAGEIRIDGRPVTAYRPSNSRDMSRSTSSTRARIARNGWSFGMRCSGDT